MAFVSSGDSSLSSTPENSPKSQPASLSESTFDTSMFSKLPASACSLRPATRLMVPQIQQHGTSSMDADSVPDKNNKADINECLASNKEAVTTAALSVLHIDMPRKIITLNKLLKSTTVTDSQSSDQDDTKSSTADVTMSDTKTSCYDSIMGATGTRTVLAERAILAAAAETNVETDASISDASLGLADASVPDASVANAASSATTTHAVNSKVHVPSNKPIVALAQIIKHEILDCVQLFDVVRVWIQLNVPKIEDGNNLGVSVQEEIIELLGTGKLSGLAVLDTMSKYFFQRGRLISKLLQYPRVEDWRQSIIELDEKEWLLLANAIGDIRNNYVILYDMIIKNLDRITRPRGTIDHRQNYY
jgi:Proteasome activator PA28, C-terminal